MHRNADSTSLIRYGAGDSLTYPPCGVCGELVSFAVVKLFYRLYETQVALLNKVKEQHPTAHIAFGYRYNKAQVCLRQLALGLLIPLCHALGDLNLLCGAQQGHLAYFLKVHTNGVIYGDALRSTQIVLYVGDILRHICGVRLFHHVDIEGLKAIVNPFDLLGIQLQLLQSVHYLLVGEHAFAFAQLHKILNLILALLWLLVLQNQFLLLLFLGVLCLF